MVTRDTADREINGKASLAVIDNSFVVARKDGAVSKLPNRRMKTYLVSYQSIRRPP